MGCSFAKVELDLAHNVIYGAIEYAEYLGLAPHKDFGVTEYILEDVETISFMDIEFGQEGKPLYVSVPNDNVEKVLRTLDKNIGRDNYDYIMNLEGMF